MGTPAVGEGTTPVQEITAGGEGETPPRAAAARGKAPPRAGPAGEGQPGHLEHAAGPGGGTM